MPLVLHLKKNPVINVFNPVFFGSFPNFLFFACCQGHISFCLRHIVYINWNQTGAKLRCRKSLQEILAELKNHYETFTRNFYSDSRILKIAVLWKFDCLKFLRYIKFNNMLHQIFSEDQFMLPHLIKFRQTVNKDRNRFAKWFALTLLGSFFLGSVVQDFWGDFLPAVHSPGEGFGRRMKLGRKYCTMRAFLGCHY